MSAPSSCPDSTALVPANCRLLYLWAVNRRRAIRDLLQIAF